MTLAGLASDALQFLAAVLVIMIFYAAPALAIWLGVAATSKVRPLPAIIVGVVGFVAIAIILRPVEARLLAYSCKPEATLGGCAQYRQPD